MSQARAYKRTLQRSIDNCRTNPELNTINEMFNTMFHSSLVYMTIIDHANKMGVNSLYYCAYNIHEHGTTQSITYDSNIGSGVDLFDELAPNGRYLVRFASKTNEGHAICVVKSKRQCIVYDSNDSCDYCYNFWATDLFVSNIACTAVVSGYGDRTHSPMVYNICTLFALYVWLIGEAPINNYEDIPKNKKKHVAYTMNILVEVQSKLRTLELPELSDYIDEILKMTKKFN